MDHRQIDKRSLEMSQAVVRRVDEDPERWIEHAKANIHRWNKRNGERAGRTEWLEILNNSTWPEIREILLAETDEGQRLRQNSPFTGVITQEEREKIYLRFSCTRSIS